MKRFQPINVEHFQHWLTEKADEVVGMSGTSYSCPIATYLKELHDAPIAQVGTSTYHVIHPITGFLKVFDHTPAWARVFIYCLDQRYHKTDVTGSQCLSLLQES